MSYRLRVGVSYRLRVLALHPLACGALPRNFPSLATMGAILPLPGLAGPTSSTSSSTTATARSPQTSGSVPFRTSRQLCHAALHPLARDLRTPCKGVCVRAGGKGGRRGVVLLAAPLLARATAFWLRRCRLRNVALRVRVRMRGSVGRMFECTLP